MSESVKKECVLICGGTGLIGSILRPFLMENGYDVYVLSRRQSNSYTYHWDPKLKEFPIQLLNKVDHIINLSGLSLMKRWTASYKKKLLRSRTIPTRFLHEVLSSNPHQVKTFINASGINIYGDEVATDINAVAQSLEAAGLIPPGASGLVPSVMVGRTGYQERDILSISAGHDLCAGDYRR